MATDRLDQFSKLIWRFQQEYPDVWHDDHALALWCRMLTAADMAWPLHPTLPALNREGRKALQQLLDDELVLLLPGGQYTIRGHEKERASRKARAVHAARARWDRERADAGS